MRARRAFRATVSSFVSLGVLLGVLLVPVGSVSGASSDPAVLVKGMTGFFQIVATADRIFLSPGESGSSIAIMRPDGSRHGTLTDVPGASGMVVHQQILYVASTGASRIDRFDLSTDPPTRLEAWSTSPIAAPRNLGVASGRLWFTNCVSDSKLGGVRLTDGLVRDETPAVWPDCPFFHTSTFTPDLLFAWEPSSASRLHEYDVSSGDAELVVQDPWEFSQWPGGPIRVMPSGLRFATGWPQATLSEFSVADMTGPKRSYTGAEVSHLNNGLAVTSANGGWIAGSTWGIYQRQVWAWQIGTLVPARSWDLGYARRTYDDGLVFAPDGQRLYAVSGEDAGEVRFHVLYPSRSDQTVVLSVRRDTLTFGEATELKVWLVEGPPNGPVDIWQDPADGPPSKLRTVTVDEKGKATVRIRPATNTVYEARSPGSASWFPDKSERVRVAVRHSVRGRMLRADGTDGRYSLYRRSSRIWYRTDVRPPHPGEAILVTLEYQRKRSWQLGGRAWFVQDSSGVSLIYFAKASLPLGNYRLSSKMPQDAYHAPGTSAWAYFRVIR